jgi:hypothetical protein
MKPDIETIEKVFVNLEKVTKTNVKKKRKLKKS